MRTAMKCTGNVILAIAVLGALVVVGNLMVALLDFAVVAAAAAYGFSSFSARIGAMVLIIIGAGIWIGISNCKEDR